jgi:hypothetical protein
VKLACSRVISLFGGTYYSAVVPTIGMKTLHIPRLDEWLLGAIVLSEKFYFPTFDNLASPIFFRTPI